MIKIDEVFNAEGFPGLIALLLHWIDDELNVAIVSGTECEHVCKMARIVLAKLLNPEGWKRYWKERKVR